MEVIDESYNKFLKLLEEIKSYDSTIYSEQDTRVKIIDRILVDVLNFQYKDIGTEVKAGKGFIDYKIVANGLPKLIIEAKKDGIDFSIDSTYSGRAFNLNGPVFKDKSIQDGLDQGIYYAATKGVELACLTNGKTWIIYRANRLGDGKEILTGKGIVFSSLDSIKKEFKLFYELLSFSSISNLTYRALFQEAEGDIIRRKDFSHSLIDENNVKVMNRESYSNDFDNVMNTFFSRLNGDDDPDMLTDCFVESKESKQAEISLSRISTEIINRVKSIETTESEVLTELIEKVKTTNRHEFVVLIGGKGAGKSTFVDRFFKNVLPDQLKNSCTLIRINLAESAGDINTIIDWLNQSLIDECEKVVFNTTPTYEEIKGMFFFEYDRLRKGSWKELYTSNKSQFAIDFGKHIENRRETKPEEYIKRIIGDVVKSRYKVPCIIFDNTDHFSIEFQDKVFQYARSIYEKEVCLIIVPITDKTSWQLSKQGSIQSFENEALFLPTPSPKKIIEKRIDYLDKKLDIEKNTRGNYFLNKGIKLEIKDIEGFVKFLQGLFLKELTVSKWIGNFSNHDIRRCLELTRDIISSPHLQIVDFIKLFISNNQSSDEIIKPYKVKNAIIKKHYQNYPIGNHKFIQNLFYLDGNINTTPILSIRILQVLLDKAYNKKEDNYIIVDQVLDYFSAMGIERSITSVNLDYLLKNGLVLSYDPTVQDLKNAKKIEISSSGKEHIKWCLYDNEYLFIMLEVTPISDRTFFEHLKTNYYNWGLKNSLLIQFLNFIIQEDVKYCSVPEHDAYKSQQQINEIIGKKITTIESWQKR